MSLHIITYIQVTQINKCFLIRQVCACICRQHVYQRPSQTVLIWPNLLALAIACNQHVDSNTGKHMQRKQFYKQQVMRTSGHRHDTDVSFSAGGTATCSVQTYGFDAKISSTSVCISVCISVLISDVFQLYFSVYLCGEVVICSVLFSGSSQFSFELNQ